MRWRADSWQVRLALAVLGIALVGAWLFWRCGQNPNLFFLARHNGAEWIVYSHPPTTYLHQTADWKCIFRKEIVLPTAPASGSLTVRAFKAAQVAINGNKVELSAPSANWKLPQHASFTQLLHPGTNEVLVTVANTSGPPALWLRLELDQQTIGTDESWAASLAGAEWRWARRAGGRDEIRGGNQLDGGSLKQTVPTAFLSALPWFAFLTALCTATWLIADRWSRSSRKKISLPLLTLAITVILWIALAFNNAPLLPKSVGFDSQDHIQYINYIREHKRVPFAEDGFQMFQPPLYYIVSACALGVLNLPTDSSSALLVLHIISLSFGLAHLLMVYLAARLLFPQSPTAHCLCVIGGGTMPMLLYMSQYITNEAPMAAFVGATVVICLFILKTNRMTAGWHVLLGLCLGAAMLTKVTALVAVPVIFTALAGRLFAQRQKPIVWLRTIGVAMPVTLLVCSWYYASVWKRYGSPIVLSWDKPSGHSWWQEPGYQTANFFLSGGEALNLPFYSGRNSFWDGLYSTMWGDALWGGVSEFSYRPAWNYSLVNAGYLLAVIPTLLIAWGAILLIRRWLLRPTAEQFLVIGIPAAFAAAIALVCLRAPYFASVKAFYGLSALAPLCALGAFGWLAVRRWNRGLAIVIGVITLACGANSISSFWIIRGTEATQVFTAFHRPFRDMNKVLETANSDPTNAQLARVAAMFLDHNATAADALPWAERALALSPANPDCQLLYGRLLRMTGKREAAIEQLQAAMPSIPDSTHIYYELASTLSESKQLPAALEMAQRGLANGPAKASMHALTGTIFLQQNESRAAKEHLQLAVELGEDSSLARLLLAQALSQLGNHQQAAHELEALRTLEPENTEVVAGLSLAWMALGRPTDAAKLLQETLAQHPDDPHLLNNLAWLRATHSDVTIRDGKAAVKLARQAEKLTSGQEPVVLGTLAAALAEAGQFPEAIEKCSAAIALAEAAGNAPLAQRNRDLLEEYEAHKAHREAAVTPTP